MLYKTSELKNKQIICIENGGFMGYLGDIEVNSKTGKIENLIIFGRPKYLGVFGKCEDIVIPWNNIEIVGNETILVTADCEDKISL